MTSTLPPLVQACSGAIGSATANTLVYPLDLITTRLQLDVPVKKAASSSSSELRHRPKAFHPAISILQRIVHKYGWSALYDGIGSDTGATLLSNFFYFYFYSFLRREFLRLVTRNGKFSRVPSAFEELALGFMAGVASRAISTPLNIVTLRLQMERYGDSDESDESDADKEGAVIRREAASISHKSGLLYAVERIYDENGLKGFWRGFSTTTLLSLNPSITMMLFQLFRRVLALMSRSGSKFEADPKPGEAFVGAAIANAIASTILYPLILAKTLVQSSSATSSITLPEALTSKGRGGRGAYQALDMQLIKGCINQGVTFLIKGRIEQLIVQAYMRRLKARTAAK